MAFCPKCKGEYLEGYDHCVFCNVDLVDKLPEGVAPEPLIKLIEVCNVKGDVEANIVKTLLEANDIQVIATGHNVQSVWPLTVDGLGEVKLLVKEEDSEKAKELIKEMQKTD